MTKAMITGAAGMIGSAMANMMAETGQYQLVLVDNLHYGHIENLSSHAREFFYDLDIRDSRMFGLTEGVDTVFHLAAVSSLPQCQTNPAECMSVNVEGTANVLEAARRAKSRRFVFASSSAVYENTLAHPFREDNDVDPRLVYPMSKLMGEQLCRGFQFTNGMDITILRYFNTYGGNQDIYRQNPALVGYIIRELLAGNRPVLHSNGNQRRDYVYVEDVVNLNLRCMLAPEQIANGVFNVASGETLSVNEIYLSILRVMNIGLDDHSAQPRYQHAQNFWDAWPDLNVGHRLRPGVLEEEVNKLSIGEATKARRQLGWSPLISFQEGLRLTIQTIKERLDDSAR